MFNLYLGETLITPKPVTKEHGRRLTADLKRMYGWTVSRKKVAA